MGIEAVEHEKPKHDATWWIGQAIALTVTAGLIWHGYAGPVAAAVGYALAVLVDIREAVCAPNEKLTCNTGATDLGEARKSRPPGLSG